MVTPLETRIDVRVATAFRAVLLEQIERGDASLLINLARVEFIDSSGLGAIVSTLKRLGQAGELKVSGLNGAVRTMFELTRLNRVIPIVETPAASPVSAQ